MKVPDCSHLHLNVLAGKSLGDIGKGPCCLIVAWKINPPFTFNFKGSNGSGVVIKLVLVLSNGIMDDRGWCRVLRGPCHPRGIENEPLQFWKYFTTSLNYRSLGPGECDEQYINVTEYTYNY